VLVVVANNIVIIFKSDFRNRHAAGLVKSTNNEKMKGWQRRQTWVGIRGLGFLVGRYIPHPHTHTDMKSS